MQFEHLLIIEIRHWRTIVGVQVSYRIGHKSEVVQNVSWDSSGERSNGIVNPLRKFLSWSVIVISQHSFDYRTKKNQAAKWSAKNEGDICLLKVHEQL